MSRRKSRPARGPLDGHNKKLHAEQIDGLVGRWVNDEPGRLEQYHERGWEYRTKKGSPDYDKGSGLDSRISRFVGYHKDNSPMRAYLMDIHQEWYDEDQATKQKINDQVDEVIKAGVEGVDNSYIPKSSSEKTAVSVRRE